MWAHFTTSQILIPFFHALKWKSIYALHKAECIFTNFCFYHVTSKIAENEFIYVYIWRWWCVHKGITSANSEAHKDRKQPNEMSLNNTKRMSRLSAPTLNAIVKFHFFFRVSESSLFVCAMLYAGCRSVVCLSTILVTCVCGAIAKQPIQHFLLHSPTNINDMGIHGRLHGTASALQARDTEKRMRMCESIRQLWDCDCMSITSIYPIYIDINIFRNMSLSRNEMMCTRMLCQCVCSMFNVHCMR